MKKRCKWALCPNLTDYRYCDTCKPKAEEKRNSYTKLYDKDRRIYQQQYREFYSSLAWRNLRREILAATPICVKCNKEFASECHHVIEIKEDWSKRLDKRNIEPLCKSCHNKEHK